jgi:hypothetical protein
MKGTEFNPLYSLGEKPEIVSTLDMIMQGIISTEYAKQLFLIYD